MMILSAALLSVALQASACGPGVPPAPGIDQIRNSRDRASFNALLKLADGSPVPATLRLPILANADQLFDFMKDQYPPALRADSAQHPIAFFWACIDTTGAVARNAQLIGSTNIPLLDTLALRTIAIARFEPVLIDGKKVALWVPFPVQVTPHGRIQRPAPSDLGNAPVFTPYTVPPKLLNRDSVALALVQNYPPALRTAGIGGTVKLWLFIDAEGVVHNAVLKESSGQPELDSAAIKVAHTMKFEPALNRTAPVPVWVQVPINFNVPK